MEYLSACYRTKFRLYVNGQERIAPVRWYFAPPGAKLFPYGHCFWSRIYLKEDEWPEGGVGEVNDHKGLTDGVNPGYSGQCFVGDAEWFADGNLPSLPTGESLPTCCGPQQSDGGLILGGNALTMQLQPGQGGLVLGGSGRGTGPLYGRGGLILGSSAIGFKSPMTTAGGGLVLGDSATSVGGTGGGGLVLGGAVSHAGGNAALGTGGLVLGGAASAAGGNFPQGSGGLVLGGAVSGGGGNFPQGSGAMVLGGAVSGGGGNAPAGGGGLVIGGSGTASGGGGGTVACSLCPGGLASAVWQFLMSGVTNGGCTDCANLNRTYRLTYNGSCSWGTTVSVCGTTIDVSVLIFSGQVEVLFGDINLTYLASISGWDCRSPITLTRTTSPLVCTGYPSTITLTPA